MLVERGAGDSSVVDVYDALFRAEENTIVGNTVLYGATAGRERHRERVCRQLSPHTILASYNRAVSGRLRFQHCGAGRCRARHIGEGGERGLLGLAPEHGEEAPALRQVARAEPAASTLVVAIETSQGIA